MKKLFFFIVFLVAAAALTIFYFKATGVIIVFGSDFEKARKEMVEYQIRGRGINDQRVLAAMLKVERHKFVPEAVKPLSYHDGPLPIGEGQTISQPFIVALMTQCLLYPETVDTSEAEIIPPSTSAVDIPKFRVLEIGTGSGYQAAVLGELAYEVCTIEIVEPLGKRAEKTLSDLGYKNVFVRVGDGYRGWPEKAPFDGIIVTCAPEDIPKPLLEQLNPAGGRMVIPVGPLGDTQQLLFVKRDGNKYEKHLVTLVMFVPMTGEITSKK